MKGPFKIVSIDEDGSYSLKDCTGEALNRKFTMNMLKICPEELFQLDSNFNDEIEFILDDRKSFFKKRFF